MDLVVCPICHGDKMIVTKARQGEFRHLCPKCEGEGRVPANPPPPPRNIIKGS